MKLSPKKLRTQAEKLLAKTPREVAAMPVGDVQKLVHELQVHQIELEMQNDELRRTQEELEVARERLRLPYDAAPVGFLTLDARGVIQEANLAAARLLNFDRVKLPGQKLTHFIAPESQDVFYLHCRQLRSSGEKQTCELHLLRTVGPGLIARLESVVETAGPVPATRFLAMLSDITVRKRGEAALKQARDELEQRVQERTKELTWAYTALHGEKEFSESLIELAPAVIAVVDAEGNLIRTNAYAEQLAGYPFAETQGRNIISLFVPKEEEPRVRRLLRETLQGQAVQQIVAPLRTRDGSIRQIEWFAKPLPNSAGKMSAVLAIGQDISKRLLAEDALRRSEHYLSNFFDQAPIGLVWLSASGTILRANRAQMDLMGYAAENYVGRSFVDFCGERAQGRELLARLAVRETVRNLRLTQRCKHGTIRHVLVDANSFWSGSQFEYSSIFLRDITDRINLEQEVLHISEREQHRIAQDLHDGLGQLLVGTAYLANLLQRDLAAKSLPEARRLSRILDGINDAIWQTRHLARGLHPVEPEANGLMAALESLAGRTQKLFHVRCRFNCRRPVLIQDNTIATHLFRIAQEAVTNAIKHANPGRIEINLTKAAGRMSLMIKDDGLGMPDGQGKPAGLGMRIMRYRAGMIGGSLATRKETGGGTTIACTVALSDGSVRKHPPKTAGKKD